MGGGGVDRVWGRCRGINDLSGSSKIGRWSGSESPDKRASGGAIAPARLRALNIA